VGRRIFNTWGVLIGVFVLCGASMAADELIIQDKNGRRTGQLRLDQDRGTADIFDARSNREGWGTRRPDGSWDLYNKDGTRRGVLEPARPGLPSRLILTPVRKK